MQFPDPDARVFPGSIQCTPPPINSQSKEQERIVGSLVGLAVGNALGASVESRPHQYLVDNPVKDLQGGGTWGLNAGQWTDDTSMALCLASSLITQQGFDPYDQMVRYKWWYKKGFLSSTGQCFDIGSTTRSSLEEFIRRQNILKQHFRSTKDEEIDNLSFDQVKNVRNFDVFCGSTGQAGNGPLMRLAPVPLFYFQVPEQAVRLAGESARLTHGDRKAVDACRYYAALIVAAIHGESKDQLLSDRFYEDHQQWFGRDKLDDEVLRVARGSYKKKRGYEEGIRGKNYIVNTLEAALWAFWSDQASFQQGVLSAVNLGDDTDTTAAVYGQLAGAYYGVSRIPRQWADRLYALDLLICVSEWLYFQGSQRRNDPSRQQHIRKVKVDPSSLPHAGLPPGTRRRERRFAAATVGIEWVLVENNADYLAHHVRQYFERYSTNADIDKLIFNARHNYIEKQLTTQSDIDEITYYFDRAAEKKEPEYLLQAYTAETEFYRLLNVHLAQAELKETEPVEFKVNEYCACIAGIITHHPKLYQLSFCGKCYRGMSIKKNELKKYIKGSRLLTKPFLSSSRDRAVATSFATSSASENTISVLCAYDVRNPRSGLNLEKISMFPDEKEILIMPFTAFKIMDVSLLGGNVDGIGAEINLKECEHW